MKKLVLYLFSVMLSSICLSQENFPENGVRSNYKELHAFVNGTIHLDSEKQIKRSILLIRDGKIIDVGPNVQIPAYATIYNLEGAHIYPSFIDVYSSYGMPKVSKESWSPKPQINSKTPGAFSWNQALKPEYNAGVKFVPNKTASDYRHEGFGLVSSFLNDGIVRGTSVLVKLGDGSPQEELEKTKSFAHYSFDKGSSRQNYPSSYMGSIALLRQSIYDAIWANHNGDQNNLSLLALHNNLSLNAVIEIDNHHAINNVQDIEDEFKMNFIIKGNGDEYQSLASIENTNRTFILPLNFPKPYDVSDPYESLNLSLKKMKHWELAPANASLLKSRGLNIVFTIHDLKNKSDFLGNLRKTVDYGLSKKDALYALTEGPAKLLGLSNLYGRIMKGMVANFIICSGNLFDSETKIKENWVSGKQYIINPLEDYDYRGGYILKIDGEIQTLKISGNKDKLKGQIIGVDTIDVKININQHLMQLVYADSNGEKVRLSGHGKDPIEGQGQLGNGDWVSFNIKRKEAYNETLVEEDNKVIDADLFWALNDIGEQWFPNCAYGWTEKPEQKALIFSNATVWTNEQEGVIKNASVAIFEGAIIAVGNDAVEAIKNKYNFEEIDLTGKHLTSGIIDEHSHIALRSVNESSQASAAEVRIADAIRPDDINIYRQLAGGVTCSQLLHGSANPIGGQSALIKMRWGSSAKDMLFKEAKPFIKFALGENVKQSNWGDYSRYRFPQTRMGVEQVYYDSFIRARDYEKKWQQWNRLSSSDKKNSKMPHKDLDLECILEILNDQREITCHSYQQSEINMLMQVADSMNITLNTFTHILEGYKVAEKMKTHGAGGSTFSDWWAYKYEVNDAIPHNGSLLNDMGIVTAFNSDDAEMARRLNQEAAKAVKYGGTSEEDAWKFVTLNPAKLLHIDHKVGSLKKGKDADLVIWSGHPLSIYTKAEQTYVDGRCYYSLENDLKLRKQNNDERNRIIQKMLAEKNKGKATQKVKKDRSYHFHCDTNE